MFLLKEMPRSFSCKLGDKEARFNLCQGCKKNAQAVGVIRRLIQRTNQELIFRCGTK